MILEIFSLEALISFMDWTISSRLWLASSTRWAVSVISPDTLRVFSALRRVIAVISVVEEDVSSRVAACSDVPCASDWLADATWPAAGATRRGPSLSLGAHWRKG